ncbi:MAG: aminotransferase class I/II-fold pyridoxal phosphate-dependent enzyme [Clostridium sp.]|nr:aminotransferase class I/II-fold pyridoxal phosphate-dependent enzyme [Clostridium sp.]
MEYDFTTLPDRRGRDALALDGLGTMPGFAPDAPKDGFDPIPMWVADMNFKTFPAIPEAIIARAAHPAYGYYAAPDEFYGSIIRWQRMRNGAENVTKEEIGYHNGVLGGVVSALRVLLAQGDTVLVNSPTYVGFRKTLRDNGYHAAVSPLRKDEKGIWRMDLEDMEEKIKKYHIHTAILCSPHNPTGRVWEMGELKSLMELYRKYDVYVISDEIWSDLILPGKKHIPAHMVSEDAAMRTVSLYAVTKTFNLAGLDVSYDIIFNPRLRDLVRREAARTRYNTMNVLSMHALMAAYGPGGDGWVDELVQVLAENADCALRFFAEEAPEIRISRPEGTYMLFLECGDWLKARGMTIKQLLKAGWDVGVAWQDGTMFDWPDSIRMNLALPNARVREALDRLKKYVFRG